MRYLLVSVDKTDKKEVVIPNEILVKEKEQKLPQKRKLSVPTHPSKKIQISKPLSK